MNAVLAEVLPASPVAAAVRELEAVRGELAALDARIAECQRELDAREVALHEYRIALRQAVLADAPRPKPFKVKGDAETALPILRGERKEIVERVNDAEGRLRRALVEEVARRCQQAEDTFAAAARQLTEAWEHLIGTHALLEQAGVRSQPLPPALLNDFSIPAVGKMRPICENHVLHFMASNSIAQGAAVRAQRAARAEVEGELGMRLPW